MAKKSIKKSIQKIVNHVKKAITPTAPAPKINTRGSTHTSPARSVATYTAIQNAAKKSGVTVQSPKAAAREAQARSIATARNNAVKVTSHNTKGYPTKAQFNSSRVAQTAANVVRQAATTNARAAAAANKASDTAQAQAMAYNAQQAAQANAQNQANMQRQMEYNATQAALANSISEASQQRAMNYNTSERTSAQAYNTAEREAAQAYNTQAVNEERAWQEAMSNTSIQRRMEDLRKAGLNPLLAYTLGGASVGGGAAIGTHAASIAPASVGSISGNAASAGLLGANAGSVGGYQGAMENTSNQLALFGAAATAFSSALEALRDLDINYKDEAVALAGKAKKPLDKFLDAIGIPSTSKVEKTLKNFKGFK